MSDRLDCVKRSEGVDEGLLSEMQGETPGDQNSAIDSRDRLASPFDACSGTDIVVLSNESAPREASGVCLDRCCSGHTSSGSAGNDPVDIKGEEDEGDGGSENTNGFGESDVGFKSEAIGMH